MTADGFRNLNDRSGEKDPEANDRLFSGSGPLPKHIMLRTCTFLKGLSEAVVGAAQRAWTVRNASVRALPGLFVTAALCLLFSASTAHAFGTTECAASRKGSDLGCTANDVSITGIAVAPGSPASCVGGTTFTVDLDVTVNFATPDRWDIGIFLTNDGKNPQLLPANGGSTVCSVGILPITSPFLNLDSNGGTDTCGDGNSSINGGLGSGVVRLNAVPVACQAVNLSNGNLFIPFVVTWDNQASPSGATCTSIADPVPSTTSKCNSPRTTVATEVAYGTVNAVVLPAISKSDGAAVITAGDSTTYTVVITNTTGATLSSAIFRDPAVADLTVNSLTCSAAGGASCPAAYSLATLQGGGIIIPAMPADSSVTFTLNATVSDEAPAGTITNTALVTVGGETNSASDTNTVIRKFAVSKAFTPASISAGGTSVMSVTLRNTNLGAATGVAFTDTYPANLVNTAAPGVANTCGGTAAAAAGGGSLSLSGGTLASGATCTVTVNVTSAVAGAYSNSTGTVTSNEYTGDPASAFLAVGVPDLSTSAKSLQDLNGGEPDPGDVIRYTVTLTENAGNAAAGVSVTDTFPAALSGMTVVSCPAGAVCSVAGQTLTATAIAVPANGTAALIVDATIPPGTPAGTPINNCAAITAPSGIGASPCASTITVSPSAVRGSGNKPLYLYDGTSTPAYKLSRAKPSGTPASVAIAKGGSQIWTLGPALATPVTISPNVAQLAIIPVELYLASNTANESRTVQVDVTCSGGGTIYTQTKIFDGTALHNPYLPATPTLVSFANLTISAEHLCAAGQTWNLTVRNTTTGNGTRNVIVHPVSGGNNSSISLPSLNVINVDSVTGYSAAYPAVTAPGGGYYGGGQTVYVRAVVSDPFGSFDITSAAVTIRNPNNTAVVTDAAMSLVADSGTSTRTYEYAYVIPVSGPTGYWTVSVTAREGTENNVSDSGTGTFSVGMPNLTVVKSVQAYSDPYNNTTGPKAIPGSVMIYAITVANSGQGAVDADSMAITDPLSANTMMCVSPLCSNPPVVFTCSSAPSCGLTYTYAAAVTYTNQPGGAGPYTYTPVPDANGYDAAVTGFRVSPAGPFPGSTGPPHPQFTLQFRVKVK